MTRKRGPFREILRIACLIVAILALIVAAKAAQNRRDVVPVEPFAQFAATAVSSGDGSEPFAIIDPYAYEGSWHKAQLHTHASGSFDAGWTTDEALRAYADRGYTFVAVTDHDTITIHADPPEGLVLIPAEENNISFPFWPLGQHAVFLFAVDHVRRGSAIDRFEAAHAQGALIVVAHPSWVGGGGLGRWDMRHLMATDRFSLMEVYNPHSDSRKDTALWHEAVARRGPEAPVYALAVDDAHDAALFDVGWTLVKAPSPDPSGLRAALERGGLVPTTGPSVAFSVTEGGTIRVDEIDPSRAGAAYEVRFIALNGDAAATYNGPLPAFYAPGGHEGFIRVELVDPATGKKAWSQPFWLRRI